ncbi:hypothetical protein QTG54_000725 [Skeletonema marinoi]|uniref:Uncharacterized protein n=1 Tax=Skeletonema marinoi TaxID=267567 RepID=A0AAD8YPH1_9STRA|nr:hypothetical protein QTG54_000725 [Skeletonema marinoi]
MSFFSLSATPGLGPIFSLTHHLLLEKSQVPSHGNNLIYEAIDAGWGGVGGVPVAAAAAGIIITIATTVNGDGHFITKYYVPEYRLRVNIYRFMSIGMICVRRLRCHDGTGRDGDKCYWGDANGNEGKFNPTSFHESDGLDKPFGRDSNSSSSTTSSGKPSLARPSLRASADDASEAMAGLKTEGDISFDSTTGPHPLHVDSDANMSDCVDKALVALNIAASLIKKDRVDARRLGMEEEHSGGLDGEDDADALFDESAGLGIRETILEMIMEDDQGSEDDEEIEKDLEQCFAHNGVSERSIHSSSGSTQHGAFGGDDNDTKPSPPRKPSPTRMRAASEPAVSPDRRVAKKFIDETSSTFGVDVLSSLIRILGQARANPHDAYHSARCLGVLLRGAETLTDAKRIVSAALEVGSRTHAKLADASRVAMVALVTDDDQSMEEVQEEEEEQTEQSEQQ